MAVISEAPERLEGAAGIARLRRQVADRDEIIVALQHVIRDLRHEIENLRVEHVYGAFGRDAQGSGLGSPR